MDSKRTTLDVPGLVDLALDAQQRVNGGAKKKKHSFWGDGKGFPHYKSGTIVPGTGTVVH